MRLRNDPQAQAFLERSSYAIKTFPVKLDANVVLEVGMGKGEMLTQLALINPEITFIGIEKYPTVAMKAVRRAQRLALTNFQVLAYDLAELNDAFTGVVEQIWLTFADPWPKKRHYKRRLTYTTYLQIYQKLLSKSGILKIKTDNDEFFRWSIHSIVNFGATITYLTTDLHASDRAAGNIATGYETKWHNQGKKINYMEVQF